MITVIALVIVDVVHMRTKLVSDLISPGCTFPAEAIIGRESTVRERRRLGRGPVPSQSGAWHDSSAIIAEQRLGLFTRDVDRRPFGQGHQLSFL